MTTLENDIPVIDSSNRVEDLDRHDMKQPGHGFWLIVVTLAVICTGMAYSFWWGPVVNHTWILGRNHQRLSYWITPGDWWSAVRGAHFVGWGGLSFIYSYHSALVTLPGFEVLFSPFAVLNTKFNLTEISPTIPFLIPKPSAWLLDGPVMLAFAWVALFALDKLARRLVIGAGIRRIVTVTVAVAIWPTLALWGHPEDVIALGISIIAVLLVVDGHHTAAAWLLGAAISLQLLALLLVPVFIGIVGLRRAPLLLARAAIIPGCLLVIVLVPDFHQTARVLLDQPTFPQVGHPTPWIHLAPKLTSLGKGIVAGGPSRIGAFVLAALAGFVASRHRNDVAVIAWLVALVFAGRCLFESVMEAYYVMPVVALLFVLSARRRFPWIITVCAGLCLTWQAFNHSSTWAYFSEMAGLILVMLVASAPPTLWRKTSSADDEQIDTKTSSESPDMEPAAL